MRRAAYTPHIPHTKTSGENALSQRLCRVLYSVRGACTVVTLICLMRGLYYSRKSLSAGQVSNLGRPNLGGAIPKSGGGNCPPMPRAGAGPVADVRRGTRAIIGARRVYAHRRVSATRTLPVVRCTLVCICQVKYYFA